MSCIGVIYGLFGNNGKEHGKYYIVYWGYNGLGGQAFQ